MTKARSFCGRCRRSHYAEGLCQWCYHRQHPRHPHQNPLAYLRIEVASMLEAPRRKCVIWPYWVTGSGYNRIYLPSWGQEWPVPQLAWRLAGRPLPALLEHTCPNRGCFNLEHLEPGA